MKWFKKKNKTQLFLSYVPLETAVYLKATKPERLAEMKEETVFPFFIKLIEKPFENWVIELTEVTEKKDVVSFGAVVDLIPKDVSDEQYKKLQPKLKRLLTKVVNDIMGHALERAEKIIKENEKR